MSSPSSPASPSGSSPRRGQRRSGLSLFFLFLFLGGGFLGALVTLWWTGAPVPFLPKNLLPPRPAPEAVTRQPSYSVDVPPVQISPLRAPSAQKITDLRTLSKGFSYQSDLHFSPGDLASTERQLADSYQAHYTLTIREPQPATRLSEIEKTTPLLPSQLPALETLLETATLSPFWGQLYREKKERTATHAHHLLRLLTKHNYYDCQTILNLRHPTTRRRALLVQADMDVVADGSDGDRLPAMPEEIVHSTHYQPTTSYSWKKTSSRPNPLIEGLQRQIDEATAQLAQGSLSGSQRTARNKQIKKLEGTISELERRSYLIAEYDPFVVLPVPIIVEKADPHAPNVGDYGLVFYQDRIFPVIVGDAGPHFKIGEASLRLAKEINPQASPYYRPVSDLSVTYLLFPGTRKEPHRAPDYAEIREECLRLVAELGGLAEPDQVHRWSQLLPSLPESSPPSAPLEASPQQPPSEEN